MERREKGSSDDLQRALDAVRAAGRSDGPARIDPGGDAELAPLAEAINSLIERAEAAAPRVEFHRSTGGIHHQVIESLMDAGARVDMNGRFLEANKEYQELVGYTEDELRSLSYRDLTPEKWHHLEQDVIRTQVLPRGYSDIYRKEYRRRDGTIIPVELRSVLLRDAAGRPVGMWAMVRDITERVAAQEGLRVSQAFFTSIFDQSPTPTWISDDTGNLVRINKACLDLLHVTEEEVIGLYNVFEDDLVKSQGLAPLIRRVYTEHVPVRFRIIWDAAQLRSLTFKDHAAVILHTSVFPIINPAGRLTNAVFQHLDVTGLTHAEEDKARLESQLLQAQKMESIGRLAGGVAHDFNNMLGVILGYTDLIKARVPDGDPLREDLDEIERAASRSADITRQLLAFSRKQIIEPRVIDLNAGVEQMHKTLARLIGEDVDLRFDPGPELCNVRIDPSQLSQILVNLAANARDAMPHGGTLRLRTENLTLDDAYCRGRVDCSPGPYVMLLVEDNGVGMDGETRSHLFEPFFTTKQTGRGTGLGLATVYGIIRQNAGFVDVTSREGSGSCFRIYLPAVAEGESPSDAPESSRAENAPIGARVLLVEDDPMVRRMAASMLETVGCTVLMAESPEHALQLCRQEPFTLDLVMTDVIMPGMTGVELCDSIHRIRPDVAVLLMSGYTADAIAHHGILEPGVHFIQKPFGKDALVHKLHEALNSGRAPPV
jgi:PAS domain S-box-containing protein